MQEYGGEGYPVTSPRAGRTQAPVAQRADNFNQRG